MVRGILAFLLGILVFQWQPVLPSLLFLFLLLPSLLLAWILPCFWRAQTLSRLLAWSVAGFLWAWLHAGLVLAQSLPAELEGKDLLLEGLVASLPEVNTERSRFIFSVENMHYQGKSWPSPGNVRLAWYRGFPELEAGQRWRLQVRLKRPHGFANPGVYDYEAWLFTQRIRATGYVRAGESTVLLSEDSGQYPLQRLRQNMHTALRSAAQDHPLAGIVVALALGERRDIGDEQWQVLRATGTNHLVAISGLHVGIVAGLVFFLLRRLWLWPLWLPTPKAAALAALLAASLYAALAGFSIPTQRALIMVAVVMLVVLAQRNISPVRVLAMALLAVLLLDPLAVLAAGVWLSFAAVAIILFGMGWRLGNSGWWWRWGRVQVLVALGLAPLLAMWFQQVPLIGALANLLAVPWVSMLVVPLVLLGTVLLSLWPTAAAGLLYLALLGLDVLWWWLSWCTGLLPESWSALAIMPWTLLPAMLGMFWLLAPRGWPARWLGLVWLLPMLLLRPAGPKIGEAWVTVLDVGQGLAVLVRTAEHSLIYDTGPPFGANTNAGELVLLPVLQHFGIQKIDTMILSHGDSDHAGGAKSLMAAMPIERFISGVDESYSWREHEACVRGQNWQWDGVDFSILSPGDWSGYKFDNNASCVLRIAAAQGAVLLTGDIEAAAECQLLQEISAQLAADVIVAPHHGSKTSSTEGFVAAVAPRYVIFSTGYRNRWSFPHPLVQGRYHAIGAVSYNTAMQGAIKVYLGKDDVQLESWRERARRYWFSP
ncbi:MAG: DNA internalization-related competence protein ComEC/Rec2 [Thiohalomonadaceae bacterium]